MYEDYDDGSAGGSDEQRANWITAVRKACRIAKKLRELGIRPYGVVRIDTATSVTDWDKDPKGITKKIIATFNEAAKVVQDEVLTIPLHHQVIPWVSKANVSVVHLKNNFMRSHWVTIR